MSASRTWTPPAEPTSRLVLNAQGVNDRMIRAALLGGDLVRVRHGVYVAAGREPVDQDGQHVLLARAEQARNPRAVISHASAAVLWGLPHPLQGDWADEAVHVTVERGFRPRRPGVTYHRARLPLGQVVLVDGCAVTSAPRTAVDLAFGRPLSEALVLLDAAARSVCLEAGLRVPGRPARRTGSVELATALLTDAVRARGRRGLDQALWLTDPGRRTAVESLSAAHLALAGLPLPLFWRPVETSAGTVRPTCTWSAERVVGDIDGALAERSRAMADGSAPGRALREDGWRIVRWTTEEMAVDPGAAVARVSRAMGVSP